MDLIQQLNIMFNPRSVAVIGASNTPGKWGYGTLSVLKARWEGPLYPVNAKDPEVLGLKAYRSVRDIPGPVDLAAIIVPFPQVPGAMKECAQKGVRCAVIMTGGFAENGDDGAILEREVVAIAREAGIRFIGPNCMGHFSTRSNLHMTPSHLPAKPGHVGVISQSGNSGTASLFLAHQMGVGISKWVCSGNEADLNLSDYLEYLAQDEDTKVIVAYNEGLREGRRFFDLARKVTRKKPVVIMKAGRTDAGAKAALSHSASLAGSYQVARAAFKQCGVIEVDDLVELIDVASALLAQPLPKGNRVGVLSMGGGYGVITSDAVRRAGLQMPPLSPSTVEKLNAVLSTRWSHGNPVDPGGDMITFPCLWPLIEDENLDSLLVISSLGTTPGLIGARPESEELNDLDTAISRVRAAGKPMVLGTMVSQDGKNNPFRKKLEDNGMAPYPTPERAARVLGHLVHYSEYLRAHAD